MIMNVTPSKAQPVDVQTVGTSLVTLTTQQFPSMLGSNVALVAARSTAAAYSSALCSRKLHLIRAGGFTRTSAYYVFLSHVGALKGPVSVVH